MYDILSLENRKNGSTEERQLLCACAGGNSTYTTDYVRTAGVLYLILAYEARGIFLQTA